MKLIQKPVFFNTAIVLEMALTKHVEIVIGYKCLVLL